MVTHSSLLAGEAHGQRNRWAAAHRPVESDTTEQQRLPLCSQAERPGVSGHARGPGSACLRGRPCLVTWDSSSNCSELSSPVKWGQ